MCVCQMTLLMSIMEDYLIFRGQYPTRGGGCQCETWVEGGSLSDRGGGRGGVSVRLGGGGL